MTAVSKSHETSFQNPSLNSADSKPIIVSTAMRTGMRQTFIGLFFLGIFSL